MDSNGHRFWLLADQSQFALPADGVMWNGADRTLQLGGRALEVPVAARNRTLQLAARPKVAVDRFGAVAWYDVATQTVLAGLRDQNPEPLVTLSSNDEVLDLVCNALGTLVLLIKNGSGQRRVGFLSTRSTWDGLVELSLAGGHDHLIDLGDERFLALRTDGKNPLLIEGKPLAEGLSRTYSNAIFQPDEKNPTPPRTKNLADLKLQNTDRIVATASRPGSGGAALVLSSNDTTKLIVVDAKGVPQIADVPDIALAYDVSWTSRNELVLFVEGHDRAAPLQVIEGDDLVLQPGLKVFPLLDGADPVVCTGAYAPGSICYPSRTQLPNSSRLHPISLPRLRSRGEVGLFEPIDCGQTGSLWHRLFVEAHIPESCGVSLFLSASDSLDELENAVEFEHVIGTVPVSNTVGTSPAVRDVALPRATWVNGSSEIPFHSGLLQCEPKKDRVGLFMTLIQRSDHVDSALRGRFLSVRLVLYGTGQRTPVIAGIRCYENRFDFVKSYLPDFYSAGLLDVSSEELGPADPADFLSRFVTLFEGVLTPIEDKVVAAHLATAPETAPTETLDWLASWLGLTLTAGLPEENRRMMIAAATEIQQRRGTMSGLALALDVATGGGVSDGQIVLLEDFRLRRTFSTILGADLERREDPLLEGFTEGSNSFLGDSLIIGDLPSNAFEEEFLDELMALYEVEDVQDEAGILEFFERLAFRLTVLIHGDYERSQRQLISQIVKQEVPAHIAARIVTASNPLIEGLYSLLGVDTYLRTRQSTQTARIQKSIIGSGDVVRGAGSLDQRLEEEVH